MYVYKQKILSNRVLLKTKWQLQILLVIFTATAELYSILVCLTMTFCLLVVHHNYIPYQFENKGNKYFFLSWVLRNKTLKLKSLPARNLLGEKRLIYFSVFFLRPISFCSQATRGVTEDWWILGLNTLSKITELTRKSPIHMSQRF